VAIGPGDGHGVGEIELALHVVIADGAQQRRHQRTVEAHHAGIAEIDGPLRFVGIATFDDPLQHPAADDEPAVGRGIPRDESQHADSRPGLAALFDQALQCGRRDQRCVGVDDQNGPTMPLEGRQGRLGGVPRAAGPALDDGRMRGERRGNVPRTRRHDTHDPGGLQAADVLHHVAQHGPAGQRVQHLGQGRLHAGAGTCGQHHHGDGRFHARPMPWGCRPRKMC
jgi:hypothetical protein